MNDLIRSEIRLSTIDGLLRKVEAGGYNHYLRGLTLKHVRGFSEKKVTFQFPVTALVGPNGGGKSTILGAAAIAYKAISPGRFFAKSGAYDASMTNWAIEYDLIDKDTARGAIQRTASFPKSKWNRKGLDRPVLLFGVSRTVPATERTELVRAIGTNFQAHSESLLDRATVDAVAAILGKKLQGGRKLVIRRGSTSSLYAATSDSQTSYSEFHFGAGEASILRIVTDVSTAEPESLILIEEIENGLHPVATRRLVEYLITVALERGCQVIFTTHSNEALEPLPPEAIWAAYNGDVVQGRLDIKALRLLLGKVEKRLAILVEDDFAKLMVETALRHDAKTTLGGIGVHALGGWSNATGVQRHRRMDPTAELPSICFIDGDVRAHEDPAFGIVALPGTTSPEQHVFDTVVADLDSQIANLTVSMQLPTSMQVRVQEVVTDRQMTNRDPHVMYSQIGEDLGLLPEGVVAGAFLAIWAQVAPAEAANISDAVAAVLTKPGSTDGLEVGGGLKTKKRRSALG